MSNIIKIKHGNSIPIPENLENYELGYAQKGLYIKDNDQIICLNGVDSFQGILPINKGGTGASNITDARANLGLGALATVNSITLSDNTVTGILPILKGGTGASTAIDACSNLGAARVEAPNDLVHNGNEITMIPSGFTGEVWFNYRTTGGINGTITSVIFGTGGGSGKYATIKAHQFYSQQTVGTSWYAGRNTATARNSIALDSGIHCVASAKSNNGSWDIGCIGNDTDNVLYFTHIKDTNYNSGTNTTSGQYAFYPDGRIKGILLTGSTGLTHDMFPSSISSGSIPLLGSGWNNNGYCSAATLRGMMGLGATTGDLAIANGGTGMNSSYTSGSASWSAANASSTAIRKYYNGLIFFGFTLKLTSALAADAKRTIGTTSIYPVGKMAVLAVYTTGNSYAYDISMSVTTSGNIQIENNGSVSMPNSINVYAAGVGLA